MKERCKQKGSRSEPCFTISRKVDLAIEWCQKQRSTACLIIFGCILAMMVLMQGSQLLVGANSTYVSLVEINMRGDQELPGTNNLNTTASGEANVEETIDTVVMSYLLHGPPMRLRMVIENALAFTEESTMVLAHISTPPALNSAKDDADWAWIVAQNSSRRSRLKINPIHYPVRGFTGKVLHTHLLNFEHAKQVLGEFGFFVFLSDDCVFHRHGVEKWIREHRMSFSIGFSANREYDLDTWRAEHKTNLREGNLTRITGEVVQHKDRYYKQRIMGTDVYQRLGSSGLWYQQANPEARFINHYQLEGSFYPVDIVQRLKDLIDEAGLRKILPDVNYFTGEIWIPCYLLKHEKDEVMRSSFVPPVIARYRDYEPGDHCCIIGPQNLYDIVHGYKKETQKHQHTGFDSIFGIKYQRPHLEAESALLYQTLCSNSDKELSCSKKIPYREWLTVENFQEYGCKRSKEHSPIEQIESLVVKSIKMRRGRKSELCND
mmetsp:Transcript_43018/g.69920  ORF Transcript_43018/g.69920 Transcript_43018/m.69920 type:complete len:491 (-) Transcript_43018:107-1579(-)